VVRVYYGYTNPDVAGNGQEFVFDYPVSPTSTATGAMLSNLADGPLTVPDSTNTVFEWTSSLDLIIDHSGLTSLPLPFDRITLTKAGLWLLGAETTWSPSTGGIRRASILVGGGTATYGRCAVLPSSTEPVTANCGSLYKGNIGDVVQLVLFQDSGGSVNVEIPTRLWASYVGPIQEPCGIVQQTKMPPGEIPLPGASLTAPRRCEVRGHLSYRHISTRP
jgi:hypothetical protein